VPILALQSGGGGRWQTDGGEQLLLLGTEGGDAGGPRPLLQRHLVMLDAAGYLGCAFRTPHQVRVDADD
jgi:hypothetical protein